LDLAITLPGLHVTTTISGKLDSDFGHIVTEESGDGPASILEAESGPWISCIC